MSALLLSPALTLALGACIPEDTTTPRGGIALHFEPNEFLKRGAEVTTADGWRVVFERTLVSFEAMPGEGCNYKEADFGGVLYDARYPLETLIRGAESRECKYYVTLRGALRFARLGPGVTQNDRTQLATLKDALDVPYSVYLAGYATYGEERVSFAFGVTGAGNVMKFVARVPEDGKVDTTFEVQPDELFRAALPGSVGPLLFTPVWLADQRGNRDGIVTNDELDRVRVTRSGTVSPSGDLALSDYFALKTQSIFKTISVNVGETPITDAP